MISSFVIPEDCVECARLWSKYEATTFEQAKLHNRLDTAQLLRDCPSIRRFTSEVYDVTTRRDTVRAIFRQHQNAVHQHADSASAGRSMREEDAKYRVEMPGFMARKSPAFEGLEDLS